MSESGFDDVMAEEWTVDKNDPTDVVAGTLPICVLSTMCDSDRKDPDEATRATVAVLGKRALGWMLACEDCVACEEHDCPAHAAEWGAIVTEAMRLRAPPLRPLAEDKE